RRPAEVDGLGVLADQRDPGLGARPPPALAGRVELPGALHSKVVVEGEVSVEVQQQVLAAALRAVEHATVDLPGGQPGGAGGARGPAPPPPDPRGPGGAAGRS